MQDSLRRNSSLLILSQAINAVGAFFFWVVCAHLFGANIIGLSIAFVSFANLISTFTNLGLPNTIVRFLARTKDKCGLFIAAFYIVFFVSVVGGLLCLIFVKTMLPKLGLIHSSTFLSVTLVLLVTCTALSSLMDGTILAFRKGEYILGKAIIVNVPRMILPFFVVSLGIKGITGVYAIVLIAGISYNLIITNKRLIKLYPLKLNIGEIKKHKAYSISNYFGGMLGVLPGTLVPIIIVSILGSESAAFFYMPMQIAAFLSIISSSTSQALLSESAQTENVVSHKKYFRNAFIHLYRLLIPAILLLCLLGWPLLRIYGAQYAKEGYIPLLILAISSLFVGINWLGDTWLNIQKRSKAYFLMNAFNAFAVIGFILIFASHGLVAVGIGWLLGQVISAAIYFIIFARNQLFLIAGSLKTR